jgi:hypothetical protein
VREDGGGDENEAEEEEGEEESVSFLSCCCCVEVDAVSANLGWLFTGVYDTYDAQEPQH